MSQSIECRFAGLFGQEDLKDLKMRNRSGIMISMNRLSTEKRRQVIGCLVEGNSIRATCRMTGVAKNTVVKLLVDLGTVCSLYMDRELRDLPCERIQTDEIWSFVYSKEKNIPTDRQGEAGDVWTWVGMDADTKLVVSFLIGGRGTDEARMFMADLASRLRHRVQLTTDGHRSYLLAVKDAFKDDVDYAMLVKLYGSETKEDRRKYSPAVCLGAEKQRITGTPDPDHVSTSYIERQNLTMRMGIRRFTRLTNAFSKKLENHTAAVALHFAHYNFVRPHSALGGRTPAMAAGVTDHQWSLDELIGLLEEAESVPVKRGRYAKTRTARREAADSK
jgi:IS1 family transposase